MNTRSTLLLFNVNPRNQPPTPPEVRISVHLGGVGVGFQSRGKTMNTIENDEGMQDDQRIVDAQMVLDLKDEASRQERVRAAIRDFMRKRK